MKRLCRTILFLFFLLKTQGGLFAQQQECFSVSNSSIVEFRCGDLLSDTATFHMTPGEIQKYFAQADTLTETQAFPLLDKETKYYVSGKVVCEDTLSFVLFPSGAGIVYTSPITFLKSTINIPADKYQPVKSEIKILSFDKYSLAPDILKGWQKNDQEGWYQEGGYFYEKYKRWENTVFANEIGKAFSLCQPSTRSALNVDWNVDYHCNISGFLLRENRVYQFWMNGGGVFLLYKNGEEEEEVYACYDPAGEPYFVQIVIDTNDIEDDWM